MYSPLTAIAYKQFSPLLLLTSMLVWTAAAQAQKKLITLCTDSSDWPPYTMSEDGKAQGLFIDTVTQAADLSGFSLRVIPTSWPRCLRQVLQGKVDGILPITVTEERLKLFHFPADASKTERSPSMLGRASYMLIASSSIDVSTFSLTSPPQPIRIPYAYSFSNEVAQYDLNIDTDFKNDRVALIDLVRTEKGAVIISKTSAEHYSQQDFFKGKYIVYPEVLYQQQYYLAFSRNSKMTDSEKNRFWQALAKVAAE
ncbi:transporter substrate-binding domain-containing protein [Parendozoicomonas sp. Alg238-R29]|uniref:substrate-binding periplasmic protein n=1 Tax=Parendozoicomonas sp. Alg238-R29 TaxID=2993446 RepID=UPI00248EDDF6|nr:transporter substrate-binding domain-containing protein [Parendozoicomonas sp. Alg238-R29]